MSNSYYNDESLKTFGPIMREHGSHMIMSGVQKMSIERIVSIDTSYSSSLSGLSGLSGSTLIAEKITGLKQLEVDSVSIPFTFYNITESNNTFTVVKQGGTTLHLVLVSGFYATVTDVIAAINTALAATYGSGAVVFSINSVTKKTQIACTANYSFMFSEGCLGHLLGFRTDLDIGSAFTSTAVAVLAFPRHLYLTINEWSGQGINNFSVPTSNSGVLSKNIIARIALPSGVTFGSMINASHSNGLLVSEIRKYTEKINILKLELALIDETGTKVGLNGADFVVNLRLLCE